MWEQARFIQTGFLSVRGGFFYQFSDLGVMYVLIFGMSLLPHEPVGA
jgi:hypothetical protein